MRKTTVAAGGVRRRGGSAEVTGLQSSQGIKELTAWLEADDAKGRLRRARRLQDLLTIVPVTPDGMSFLGGAESAMCFEEVRRCYVDGADKAVVLLCLACVERELAAQLYAAGWEPAKKVPLREVLEKAHEDGVLSEQEWRTYREIAELRNQHAHFRAPLSPRTLTGRSVDGSGLPGHVLAEDARQSVLAVARIVGRQSGARVALGPSGT